ncbi:hypothetical protein [Brevibacillus choshinensis]|uniref:Uncharacterized protein n=1 Tax=Brevibacillus choshinensis TaxID=54911 RepID=A0ABX7FJX3_BRECH|nr:hypothetical protein [Brevibacillus choshinensis]QRG65982.1 hypothetical protein JNE38_20710 [Brevibacillus choshinensis]
MRHTKVGRIYEKEKEEAVEKAVKRVGILFELNLYDLIPQETLLKMIMVETDEEFIEILKGLRLSVRKK